MDLLKLLRSFEEFLFEGTAWLVFYPLTLWRIVRRPLQTLVDAERQLELPVEEQYEGAMSPPLVLLLTIVLMHFASLAFAVPSAAEERVTLVLGSTQNLVVVRSLLFALLPLSASVIMVWQSSSKLERGTLRPPFFAQCYLTAPYAMAVSIGLLAVQAQRNGTKITGLLVVCASTVAYFAVQTAWFRERLGSTTLRALVLTIAAYLTVLVLFSIVVVSAAIFGLRW